VSHGEPKEDAGTKALRPGRPEGKDCEAEPCDGKSSLRPSVRVQDDFNREGLPCCPVGSPDGRDLGIDLGRCDGGCTPLNRLSLDLRYR